jgi:fluoride exporter
MTRRDGALVALVAAGGSLGASLRYLAFEVSPVAAGTFPRTTLLINVVGSFLLGVVVSAGRDAWWARPLFGIGVMGGLTTMSTFAVETASLARTDHRAVAVTYAVVSALAAIAACAFGLFVVRRPAR